MVHISRRRRSKKSTSQNKLFIIAFFVLLLVLSYNLISSRNKIVDLNMKDISYVELIRFENNTMTTIKDEAKLKDIIFKIDSLKGEEVSTEVEAGGAIDFINVYDNKFKKTEIARSGNFIKVSGKWYKLDNGSSNIFESIFKEYNKTNF